MAWAPDYITVAQAKAYLRIGDTADDVELGTAVTAASRAIDRATGRQFGQVDAVEARYYRADYGTAAGRSAWLIDVDDLATTTGLVVTVGGTAVTDYTVNPRNAVALGRVWTRIVLGENAQATPDAVGEEVTVTARWGWPAFPSAVVQASKLQTARFLSRRDSPYGIAGSPADGSEMRLLASVDPDVRVLLSGYVRRGGVA